MWWRSEDDINRIVLERKFMGKIRQRRPGKIWIDVLEENGMGVQKWRESYQNREKWRNLEMAVKNLKEY